jgi:osmotically inducible lipoprotein OsmB
MRRYLCVLAVTGAVLAGCGNSTGERTVTGAGIGAGAGAVLGAITGVDMGLLAIVGATAGGMAGMLTDTDELNLGPAPWDSSSSERTDANRTATAKGNAAPNQAATAADAAAVAPAAGTPQPAAAAAADPETVRGIQSGLAKLGFDPGSANGIAGAKTRSAIRAFQQQNGLPADGVPTRELAQQIQQQLGPN